MKISTSKNYDLFRLDKCNRSVTRLNKLQASMKKWGFLDAYPLHVVKNCSGFVIKDGQHRFESAKSLGIPVKYVICKEQGISIPEINNASRSWNIRDYCESYRKQGKSDYGELLLFSDTHKLPLTICAAMLSGSQAGADVGNAIKSGSLKIKGLGVANSVASIVTEARKHVNFATNRYFVDAVSKCVMTPEFSASHLIEKMQKNPGMLRQMPTGDAYLEMLETLYNYKSQRTIPLRYMANENAKKRNRAIKRS